MTSVKMVPNRFNPRAHEGRDVRTTTARNCSNRFNPRAHEGRDAGSVDSRGGGVGVSIHAPTRGATRPRRVPHHQTLVSIHAPTRGATDGLGAGIDAGLVSIHAPTRGATGDCRYGRSRCRRFNPRAHEGRDTTEDVDFINIDWFQSTRPRGARQVLGVDLDDLYQFQSTRPRGARRSPPPRPKSRKSFNPRAHEGRDRRGRR